MSETYAALLAEREAINAQIEALQADAKAEAIAEIRAKVAEFAITEAELFQTKRGNVVKFKTDIKYRNPATGQVWTGRGKPPNWIGYQDREQFLLAA